MGVPQGPTGRIPVTSPAPAQQREATKFVPTPRLSPRSRFGLLFATAALTAADPIDTLSCNYDRYIWHTTSYNDCLQIGDYNSGDWHIHLGLDLPPAGYAQEAILSCPAKFLGRAMGRRHKPCGWSAVECPLKRRRLPQVPACGTRLARRRTRGA